MYSYLSACLFICEIIDDPEKMHKVGAEAVVLRVCMSIRPSDQYVDMITSECLGNFIVV